MASVSGGEFRPEAELILCCARTRVDGAAADRIRELAHGGRDWDYLIQASLGHRVIPLVYSALQATCPGSVPEPALRALRQRFQANAERDLLVVRELPRVLTALEEAGVRAIPFKGPLLAAAVYGNLALRRFYDLDILVHPRDVAGARDALVCLGYRQDGFSATGWEHHFVEPHDRWMVDLHQRVVSRYFPEPATFDELWARREPARIDGREIPTLAPADLLLVLGVQLAKDCRARKQRLLQICDAAELIRARPDLDWDAVLRRAESIGGWRILLLDLLLANELLDAPLPDDLLRVVRADPVVRSLAAEVRARLFPAPVAPGVPLPIGTGMPLHEDSWFHLRVRERAADKARYLGQFAWNRFLRLVTPTYRDRGFLALPEPLGFLYYLVRPVRILFQLARTGHLKSRTG